MHNPNAQINEMSKRTFQSDIHLNRKVRFTVLPAEPVCMPAAREQQTTLYC